MKYIISTSDEVLAGSVKSNYHYKFYRGNMIATL